MAEGKQTGKVDAAGKAPAGKGGKGKLIAIVVIAVLLAGGGTAAWLLLRKAPDAQAAEAAKAAARKLPVFVDLDSFTVNLRDPDSDRFMQVKLVATVKDNAVGEQVKTLMPAVRNEILLLLGSKQSAEVASREGKEKLAREIVVAANKALEGTPAAGAVEAVSFTHIIIQ